MLILYQCIRQLKSKKNNDYLFGGSRGLFLVTWAPMPIMAPSKNIMNAIAAFANITAIIPRTNRTTAIISSCLLSLGGSGMSRLAIIHYLANSIARVSRMTFTLMVPGYCIVLSILLAISLASRIADKSSTFCGRTNTRTSRPALIA